MFRRGEMFPETDRTMTAQKESSMLLLISKVWHLPCFDSAPPAP
jgi:hypothetical protein